MPEGPRGGRLSAPVDPRSVVSGTLFIVTDPSNASSASAALVLCTGDQLALARAVARACPSIPLDQLAGMGWDPQPGAA